MPGGHRGRCEQDISYLTLADTSSAVWQDSPEFRKVV
ncbi:hypothetical protein Mal52_30050 [Symmachiella dynata]|uniref:Uncharacterized protein n=1 Tax=Symmachiella dynata TaxID=2527995 RepID=A0A517ZPV7_9PLAN|nr:hypothetical protein Mal52_30050 [Symmachiella dynata]